MPRAVCLWVALVVLVACSKPDAGDTPERVACRRTCTERYNQCKAACAEPTACVERCDNSSTRCLESCASKP